MLRGRRNPHELKVNNYLALIVKLNDYLAIFPGSKEGDKLRETELNVIILHSILNGCTRQDCGQIFDFEVVTLKKAINMFDHMEVSESIYKGVLYYYYKMKTTRSEFTLFGNRRKRGENPPCQISTQKWIAVLESSRRGM